MTNKNQPTTDPAVLQVHQKAAEIESENKKLQAELDDEIDEIINQMDKDFVSVVSALD